MDDLAFFHLIYSHDVDAFDLSRGVVERRRAIPPVSRFLIWKKPLFSTSAGFSFSTGVFCMASLKASTCVMASTSPPKYWL